MSHLATARDHSEWHVDLVDAQATEALGATLAPLLTKGDVLLLHGDLGAGKTTLARALIREAQTQAGVVAETVPSPTFTLVQTYEAGGLMIWHVDLYRVEQAAEIDELGLDDALDEGALVIEWPDRLGDQIPPDRLEVHLVGDNLRHARLIAFGDWQARLQACDFTAGDL